MLTIVFYGKDGEAAKARARSIAGNKPDRVRIYDAFVWNGQDDACDAVEILPCVPSWRRSLIESVFAGKLPEKIDLSVEAHCSQFINENANPAADGVTEEIAPKKRGGWPKGKPRRKVAA